MFKPVLKETLEHIEIHSLREEEECPSCGSTLAESLIRRALRPKVKISPTPKIQTANALLLPKKLLIFDIPKIDCFIGLVATDLCCISGYQANLLLTRLCIRSLLPENYSGLNSPYVMVADAGNYIDVYGAVNFARLHHLLPIFRYTESHRAAKLTPWIQIPLPGPFLLFWENTALF